MFCPLCRTEYREGFTTCSDCQLPLVAELPGRNVPAVFASLWNGENADFRERLLEELEKAGIGAFRVPVEILRRNSISLRGLRKNLQSGYAVCVASADYPAAVRVLKSIFEQSASEPDVARERIAFNKEAIEAPPDPPLNWDPATVTVVAWSGGNENRARFVQHSLNGAGVPTILSKDEVGIFRLMIRPGEEVRGREIVRQIEEGAAPESSQISDVESLWYDDPVESYTLLWIASGAFLVYWILCLYFIRHMAGFALDSMALSAMAVNIGGFWALYQAIRYEIRPLRFILIAFVPLSFVWYYYERYSKRRGIHRLPIAVRMRMSPPPSA